MLETGIGRAANVVLAALPGFTLPGDTSAGLFVHPNTFRYRLRRLPQVGELDLADPGARFGIQLQLRIFPTS